MHIRKQTRGQLLPPKETEALSKPSSSSAVYGFQHGNEDWCDDSRLSKPHCPGFSKLTSDENVGLKTIAMIYVANTSMETLLYARIQVPVRIC